MLSIRRHADSLIRLLGPVDEGADPPAAITTATVTGRLYDSGKDDTLLAAEPALETVLRVSGAHRFEDGDTVRIELDAGGHHETTIASRDESAGTITLAAGLPGDARAGSRIAAKLGADVPLSPFNAAGAAVGTFDWGFQGVVEDDHAGLYVGQTVRVEITLDDGADRIGLEWFETMVEGPG